MGLHGHAAIDGEDLTRDIAGIRAGKEKSGIGDVINLAEVGQGNLGDDALLEVIGEFLGHIGGDEAGSDGIASDLTAGELARDGLGQPDEAGLRCRVVGLAGISDEADDRADVDDAWIGAFHERALEGFDEVEGALQVGVENGIPVLGFHAHDEPIPRDASVVHQDIDSAEICHDRFTNFLNRVVVCDIKSVEFRGVRIKGVDLLGGGTAAGGIAGNDGELGTLTREGMSDGETDAATGSGDDDSFS